MIDPSAIAQGVLASIATDRIKKPINDTIDAVTAPDDQLSEHQILYDIHQILLKMYELWKLELTGKEDIFYTQMFYTATTGSPVVLRHRSNRQRFAIYATVATIVDINAPTLGNVVKTIPADTWTWLYYPENTSFVLDGSNSFTQANLWIRETNESS